LIDWLGQLVRMPSVTAMRVMHKHLLRRRLRDLDVVVDEWDLDPDNWQNTKVFARLGITMSDGRIRRPLPRQRRRSLAAAQCTRRRRADRRSGALDGWSMVSRNRERAHVRARRE